MMLLEYLVVFRAALAVAAVEPIQREPVFPTSNGSTPLTFEFLERNL
jgi:hypothetical protein